MNEHEIVLYDAITFNSFCGLGKKLEFRSRKTLEQLKIFINLNKKKKNIILYFILRFHLF